ncbi:MAG: alpha/beta fold hydrolase [Syntrophaceae bacterium]|nr:alpha/beta fold hydrolase [Syntrophaceae bacterium]
MTKTSSLMSSLKFSLSILLVVIFLSIDIAPVGKTNLSNDVKADVSNAPLFLEVIDLGNLSGGYSKPKDINEADQIIGESDGGAFIWEENSMTPLVDLNGKSSSASLINDSGQIVGYYDNHGFFWYDGNLEILDDILDGYLSINEINNLGQVVGTSFDNDYLESRAFLWQNGTMQNLGTLGGRFSFANSINNYGTIVGSSTITIAEDAERGHAVIWQNGQIFALQEFPHEEFYFGSSASDINNLGIIVGHADPVNQIDVFQLSMWQQGDIFNLNFPEYVFRNTKLYKINENNEILVSLYNPSRSYLWKDGLWLNIGSLGGNYTHSTDINDRGQIIGSSSVVSEEIHAFLWQNGQMIDLNDLIDPNSNWILQNASAINNNGHIVGTGIHNGQPDQGFLLKPVPVLLVHGYCSGAGMWGAEGAIDFKKSLEDAGFLVETIDLYPKPSNNNVTSYVDQIRSKILEMKDKYHTDQIDIVAHSMGGLVVRQYARQHSYERYIRKLIMLGTPNNGSELLTRYWLWLRPLLAASSSAIGITPCLGLGEAAIDMKPNSSFLRSINAVGLPQNIDQIYTVAGNKAIIPLSSILWGEDDGVVRVASVQALAGTINSEIYVNHFEYDDESDVLNTVISFLTGISQKTNLAINILEETPDYQETSIQVSTIEPGEMTDHVIPIDSTVEEVHFILGSSESLTFTLTTPGGYLINPDVANSDPSITYRNVVTGLVGYSILNPEPGNWTAHINNLNDPSSLIEYGLIALLNSNLRLSPSLDEKIYKSNDSIPITAQLLNGSEIMVGAEVTAHIENPDGSIIPILLFDDGSHGDIQSNDGVYTGIYSETALDGPYDIVITANGILNGYSFVRESAVTAWIETSSIYLPLVLERK